MPVTSVEKDLDALTMTVVADFPVPVRRLWDAYTDPRQIEKFWGPPAYPATFTRHDAAVGGLTQYVMTGPEGEQHGGYWEWISVDAPHSFEVRDGFALPDGSPNTELPTARFTAVFEATESGSRVTITSLFSTLEELQQLMEMGQEEGMRQAMAQIDEVVADLASFAAGRATEVQILSETQVRVSRIIRGSVDQVWLAHNDPSLVQQWLLGPEGWTMPRCELASETGGSYVYEWATLEGEERFGFTGELLESEAPYRSVTTERMLGTDGPSTLNELTLTEQESGTLLSILITYPDAETRDAILGTGMVDGMEASYARLEAVAIR